MKKTSKLMAGIAAAALATAMVPGMALAVEGTSAPNMTADTTVKYSVTEGYVWSIPAEINFGSDKGVNTTSVVNADGSSPNPQKVKVEKNIIPDGKSLAISLAGNDGAFTIKNGSTTLNYTVAKPGNPDQAVSSGGTVLTVSAGTNTGEQALKFTLTTTAGSAEVAGDYTGTATFTAKVQ